MTEPAVALVTGAGRGLGLEVVRLLAAQGMRVIAGVRDRAGAAALAAIPGAEPTTLDVTDQASIDAVRARTRRLDVLVNNAGAYYDRGGRPLLADMDVVAAALATNALGPWRMCIAFADLLRASPHGRIVNVSAGAGTVDRMVNRPPGAPPSAETPAYTVSKAALNAMTLIVAAELQSHGVLVNAVNPGWLATGIGGPDGGPVEEGHARWSGWRALLKAARRGCWAGPAP